MKQSHGRSCGDCSLCCKILGIDALAKPGGVWCHHFARGSGCAIYAARPGECRSFVCHWLVDESLGPEWKPSKCKMIVSVEGERLVVYVDEGAPGPWREPYFSWLKAAAARGLQQSGIVLVMERGRSILVLPDGKRDLGVVKPDERIVLTEAPGGRFDARVMKHEAAEQFARNLPRAQARPA